jgi:hypothetical protein
MISDDLCALRVALAGWYIPIIEPKDESKAFSKALVLVHDHKHTGVIQQCFGEQKCCHDSDNGGQQSQQEVQHDGDLCCGCFATFLQTLPDLHIRPPLQRNAL